MIAWLLDHWRVALALAIVAGLGYGAWRIDAAAYARGVRDQQIKTIAATEMLNAGLRAAQAKTMNAALDAEEQRRELADLERRLADERARDPLADGFCISPMGMRRLYRAD